MVVEANPILLTQRGQTRMSLFYAHLYTHFICTISLELLGNLQLQ